MSGFPKWIVKDLLTARYQIGWNLTMTFFPIFSVVLMLQRCVVFAEDDAKDLLIEAFICWNFRQYDKRNLKTICLLSNWKTCSWYWLLESFRRHYEGPLTEVLPKIKWMIEKLIQDNAVVLRTIRLPWDKLVLPRDEVDWCASAGSACEELLNSLFKIGIAGQLW
jgi:hypothetical protein